MAIGKPSGTLDRPMGQSNMDVWEQRYNQLDRNPGAQNQKFNGFVKQVIEQKSSSKIVDGFDLQAQKRLNDRDNFANCSYKGDSLIRRAQASLITTGYDLGNFGYKGVDGDKGPLTTKAVTEFQKTAGLEPTGKLDQETMRMLDLVTEKGLKKAEIEKIGKEIGIQAQTKLHPVVFSQITLYNNRKLYKHEADLIFKINSIDSKFNQELNNFKKVYEKNKEIYQEISKRTGIPSELIVALHYRESGCNFNTYFHNGDPLGKPTTHVPIGKSFDNFTDAAVDALLEKKTIRDKYSLSTDTKDMAAMMAFAESYNGLGYYNKNTASPYVFSGTNVYEKGKYVADGEYDSNTRDAQPGVYILINALK